MENVQSIAEETRGFAKKKKREQWISNPSWKRMSVQKGVKIQPNPCDLNATSEYKDHLRNKYKEDKSR